MPWKNLAQQNNDNEATTRTLRDLPRAIESRMFRHLVSMCLRFNLVETCGRLFFESHRMRMPTS